MTKVIRLIAIGLLAGPMVAQGALVSGTPTPCCGAANPLPRFGTLVDFDDGITGDPLASNRYVGVGITSIANTLGPQLGFYPTSQSAPNYVGTGPGATWDANIIIEFANLQAAVGIGIAGPTRMLFELYDAGNVLLESYDVSAPTNNYYFINRAAADARYLRIFGDFIAFDDLQFGTSTVPTPEPGTLALLGLGLVGLGLSRRRKA